MLEVVYKNISFTQSEKNPNRLIFNGNHCEIPGPPITGLKSDRGGIVIECGDERFRFVLNGPKEWSLIDITPQGVVNM